MAETSRWVDFQFDKLPHAVEAIAKHEAGAVNGAEEVRDHWETASFHFCEEQRGASGGVNAALDFGDFQMGVDFGVDPDELIVALKIDDTFAKRAVAHEEMLTTETQRAQRRRVFIRRWTRMNADKRQIWICLGKLSVFICVFPRLLLCILCALRVSVVD